MELWRRIPLSECGIYTPAPHLSRQAEKETMTVPDSKQPQLQRSHPTWTSLFTADDSTYEEMAPIWHRSLPRTAISRPINSVQCSAVQKQNAHKACDPIRPPFFNSPQHNPIQSHPSTISNPTSHLPSLSLRSSQTPALHERDGRQRSQISLR